MKKAPFPSDSVEFEDLIAQIASRFAVLEPDEFDGAVTTTLGRIGTFLGVDRCFIFVLSGDGTQHRVTHVWTERDIPGDDVVVGTVVQQGFPWVGARMLNREKIVINRLEELPSEAGRELSYCRATGIKSFLMCPMYSRDSVIGNIGVDAIRGEREWSVHDLRRLRLVGEIIAGEIIRKRNEEQIRRLQEQLEAENQYLVEEIELRHCHSEIIGQSRAIQKVLNQIERVATADTSVLLLGETGTGKELLARAIHRLSPRAKQPLVTVNCAALSPTLIESELFGREKGAYTGAIGKQMGRFELADGSTLFLDEIGELPLEVQAKLLRVLQSGEFERLGSPNTRTADVRLIAATNRDLALGVRNGTFREDLYYRLNVFPITIPALRERREDIPLLLWAFIKEFESSMGRRIEGVSERAMERLKQYAWPGNVRELRNCVERSMILSRGRKLQVDFVGHAVESITENSKTLAEMEREYIRSILEQTGWRVRGEGRAAEILGLKPSTLESRMKKLGIQRP